jgi:hypothetical protein
MRSSAAVMISSLRFSEVMTECPALLVSASAADCSAMGETKDLLESPPRDITREISGFGCYSKAHISFRRCQELSTGGCRWRPWIQ